MSLTEQVVPPARLTEGMAIMHTGIVAGVAPGATLGGLVVDHHGASAAYLVVGRRRRWSRPWPPRPLPAVAAPTASRRATGRA